MKNKLKHQQGVVIIIALVMLVVMTAVGVTLMSGATLQERMAGSNRQLSLARLNAEAALRQAEIVLDNMAITSTPNMTPHEIIATNFNPTGDGRYVDIDIDLRSPNTNAVINSDVLTVDLSVESSWTSTNSVAAATTATSSTLPRYTIEYIGQLRLGVNDSSELDVSIEKKEQFTEVPHVFRVTAIGYGADDNLTAVLQSIYSTAANL